MLISTYEFVVPVLSDKSTDVNVVFLVFPRSVHGRARMGCCAWCRGPEGGPPHPSDESDSSTAEEYLGPGGLFGPLRSGRGAEVLDSVDLVDDLKVKQCFDYVLQKVTRPAVPPNSSRTSAMRPRDDRNRSIRWESWIAPGKKKTSR